MRILLTGSSGQLGRELQTTLARQSHIIAPTRGECDLSSPDGLRSLLRATEPEIILNCGAYTDVNRAESEPATAFAINAAGPRVLAEEAHRTGALLIHFSTDYVFPGDKQGPYTESDPTGPLNVYGQSKLAGEQAIRQSGCRHLIFRTSWIYGPHGHNFVRTMLRLGQERDSLSVVDDQVGAPTSTRQLADAIARLLEEHGAGTERTPYGLYHLTAAGAVSWCGFARRIFARAAQREEHGEPLRVRSVHPVASADYPTPARRPANSQLSNEGFREAFGFAPGHWHDALDAVLSEIEERREAHASK